MFENILLYVVLVAGMTNILSSFLMETKNLISGILFKFIPFVLGFGCVLYFLIVSKLI